MEHKIEHFADDPVHAAEIRFHIGIRDVESGAVREAKRDVFHRHVAIVPRNGGEGVPGGVERDRLDAQVTAHSAHPVRDVGQQCISARRFVQVEYS